MTTYTYKNTSDQKLLVMGAGEVEPGETIKTTFVVENPNLKRVDVDYGQKKHKQEQK